MEGCGSEEGVRKFELKERIKKVMRKERG